MGYNGHLWSHGIEFRPREEEIRHIYSGDAQVESLISKYGIDYIVLGPYERAQMSINEAFFLQYSITVTTGPYTLYSVKPEAKTNGIEKERPPFY